jgi:N-acetylneuraminate synthase
MAPTIIAEIGINHNGDFSLAQQMIFAAYEAGCKVVKFQCHIPMAEMTRAAKHIIPSNATENIYDMMVRCSFDEKQEGLLKFYTETFGMQYLCTPFSREAVDRLERLGVTMYKIGSGECNNYPLVKYIVGKGKPIILSTGMNDYDSLDKTVEIIGNQLHAILHCVSEYPTPYEHVNLGRMLELKERYGKPVGLSDHSKGIYTALAAVALGASVVEKHFTSDKRLPGADVPISLNPAELRELIIGAEAIKRSLGNGGNDSSGKSNVAKFAFASVVSTAPIKAGETLTRDNVWVKRPGGGIPASKYESLLGLIAIRDIEEDKQISWHDLTEK